MPITIALCLNRVDRKKNDTTPLLYIANHYTWHFQNVPKSHCRCSNGYGAGNKVQMRFSKFLDSWDADDDQGSLYLKDWHFAIDFPDYKARMTQLPSSHTQSSHNIPSIDCESHSLLDLTCSVTDCMNVLPELKSILASLFRDRNLPFAVSARREEGSRHSKIAVASCLTPQRSDRKNVRCSEEFGT